MNIDLAVDIQMNCKRCEKKFLLYVLKPIFGVGYVCYKCWQILIETD